MKREKSCGVIVFRKNLEDVEVLLVHHNLGHWGFPKGHVELDETEEETAIREVFEETGIESTIVSDFRKVITYSPSSGVEKDVVFFLGMPVGDHIIPQVTEVSEAKFINIKEALHLISHEDERGLLKQAVEKKKKNL